ncbi:D-alanine--D-alanine ligase [Lachnospiraceae bacterium AM25-11LB]|nr:D-alanine--D-alanine ligase [Lachnospiraceae bacterium AM25-22]RGD09031.1 D-alanine--D-alanine ligase [Lachnospiraceae bacterium AM25-11LB]RJW13004.1 D-alanine--D-alanine ligase [Lachnospiraceae bacterium AM25-40]RJW17079.1 D-alanine--D-alanine ligase [Lachnospiraceae bacterium AM25-39]
MNIIVLAGGNSTEREVSIASGQGVCKALRERNHKAVLLDPYFGASQKEENLFPTEYDVDKAADAMREMSSKLEETMKTRKGFFGPNVLEICKEADIVFLALHGANGEDGKVQSVLDLMGIKYTGSGPLSSGMAMDKGITKMVFEAKGVPTPKGITLEKGKCSSQFADYGMGFPVIVKPCCGGSSVGVCIANNQTEYQAALLEAFSYENEVVVEQFITGREFSVAVVDGKAYPVIEIAPLQGFYDYKNKYQAASCVETCPADLSSALTKEMQKYAEMGYKALNLQAYARLDFLMDDEGNMYCLEANTLPGMTPTSLIPQEAKAIGMDYPQLCEKLIEVSLKKYQ